MQSRPSGPLQRGLLVVGEGEKLFEGSLEVWEQGVPLGPGRKLLEEFLLNSRPLQSAPEACWLWGGGKKQFEGLLELAKLGSMRCLGNQEVGTYGWGPVMCLLGRLEVKK